MKTTHRMLTGQTVSAMSITASMAELSLDELSEALMERTEGEFKTIIRPDGLIVNEGFEPNTNRPVYRAIESEIRAGWFAMWDSVEWPDNGMPMIAVWTPTFAPWVEQKERVREAGWMESRIEKLGYLVCLDRMNGNDCQSFCIPGSVLKPKAAQARGSWMDYWGIEVDSRIDPGKLLKRLSVLGPSYGADAGVVPLSTVDWYVDRNAPAGDGGLLISETLANQFYMNCVGGSPMPETVTRLQLWILCPWGLIKGMAIVDRRNALPKGISLSIPKECLDNKIRATEGYVMKLVPHRVQRVSLLKPMDGLLRMPELLKHVDAKEVADIWQNRMIGEDNWEVSRMSMKEDYWMRHFEEEDDANAGTMGEIERIINRDKAKLYRAGALKLSEAADWSSFVGPTIMQLSTGANERSLSSRLARWQSMPGGYVSAVGGYWTYAGHVNMSVELGQVRVIWNHGLPDGFVMNPTDDLSEEVKVRSGGGDKDDMLDMVMMENDEGKVFAWLVRNPTGWGHGWFREMDPIDVKDLKAMGFHVYQLTGWEEQPVDKMIEADKASVRKYGF